MSNLQFYVTKVVVRNQDLWLDPKNFDTFIKVIESYQVDDLLFLAKDDEEAFTFATDFVDVFDDVHHDGPGDMFKSKGMGIHQLYRTYISQDRIIKKISEEGCVGLGSINIDDLTSNNNTPRIREKEELDLFKN
ncbi:MAG: hypothetical protein L3J51_03355 [Cocleimonas sp.]|nr:hypothetical protein [Cocleimonas sp.]